MLELRIVSGGAPRPLFDLPALLGRRNAAREIGDAIESLIAFMDDLGGDPDLEDSETGSSMVDATGRYLGPDAPETQDEDRELSWPEWHSRGRHKQTPGGHEMRTRAPLGGDMSDDDEDDDPAEESDDDTSVEDNPLGCDPEEDCGPDWRHQAADCDTTALHWHRDRIRAERCDKIEAHCGVWRDPFPTWRIRPSPSFG